MSRLLHIRDRWVAVCRHPDSSETVTVDLVLCKATSPVFVNVDTDGLAPEYLALEDVRVGAGLHFEPRQSVLVDAEVLEGALI